MNTKRHLPLPASLVLIIVISCATSTARAIQISLPKSKIPTCQPTPRPTPVATPKPAPTPLPSPTASPSPKPVVVLPTPPPDLPPDGPDPVSTGSPLIDQALKGDALRSMLPIWHGYPWFKIPHPKVWTAFAVETLRRDGQTLLKTVPSDIELFCPKYPALGDEERVVFWTKFISVLAEQESSFDSRQVDYEPSIGPKVFSTGFLMLSVESSQIAAYHCEMIRNQADLFEWRRNLGCAIRVMSYWMGRDQTIAWNPQGTHSWQGLARYWAPLRETRLQSPRGRQCVGEMVSLRTPMWISEAKAGRHPSILDSEYHAAGETRPERFLRMVNELPFCH